MNEPAGKSCNVYEVSDAIKERFKDEEELLPTVDVRLEDAGRIVWRFQVYSLDGSDIRGLVDLASQFGLDTSVVQYGKEHGLEVKLSTKAATIQCGKQRFELLGKHGK